MDIENEMERARELAIRFGGNPDTIDVPIGNPDGWGWADAVLAAQLPSEYDGNPYEYGAYGAISDEWGMVCDAVENGEPEADTKLQALLAKYREVFSN